MNYWPDWLDEYPAGFRGALDDLVRLASKVNEQRKVDATDPGLSRMTKDIGKDAGYLLKALHRLYKEAGFRYLDDDAKETAFDFDISQMPDLDDHEKNLLRAGSDYFSIQLPLLGLITHMEVLHEKYASGGGRPPKHFEKNMVRRLVDLSTKAGIPLDKTGSRRSQELTSYFFDNVGIPHPDQRLLTEARSKLRKESAENLPNKR